MEGRVELAVLAIGPGVMLAVNAVLLRPLDGLAALMERVPPATGERLAMRGTADVANLIRTFNGTFNGMLDRLATECGLSSPTFSAGRRSRHVGRRWSSRT